MGARLAQRQLHNNAALRTSVPNSSTILQLQQHLIPATDSPTVHHTGKHCQTTGPVLAREINNPSSNACNQFSSHCHCHVNQLTSKVTQIFYEACNYVSCLKWYIVNNICSNSAAWKYEKIERSWYLSRFSLCSDISTDETTTTTKSGIQDSKSVVNWFVTLVD